MSQDTIIYIIATIEGGEHVIQALKRNSYPTCLIQRPRKQVSPRHLGRQQVQESQEPVTRITLPYIQHLSEAINRVLRKLDIHTTFHPHLLGHALLIQISHCPL